MQTTKLVFLGLLYSSFALSKEVGHVELGKVTWYAARSSETTTASGKRLINHESVAAHKTLPFGTIVKVTNLKNGKAENVEIIDRGQFSKGRIIDVSVGVAERLGFKRDGVVHAKIEVVKKAPKKK
jgi:rare lipoprotein A